MTIQCLKCSKPSITFIRYSGAHLCKKHFIEFVERRVKKDIKKQGKTTDDATIGIALSGGKDSTVALYLMHEIFSKRPNFTLYAVTVDEGIDGYRDKSLPIAQKNCKKLGIEHHVISFEDAIGKTMDEIASLHDELGECSYCGVFRRFCLNTKTKELGVNKLVTGHNLDDMAQSILMNFTNGDMQKLARLGPHTRIQPGLVPRLLPLRTIPEKEIMLYAIVKNIEFHNAECPYSMRALRGSYREIIDTLEDSTPGTRHSILNSYESIKELLLGQYPAIKLNTCPTCGEPTSQRTCKTCLLKKRIM
ncbi:MAG: TIGR00269 family protein [Thermoplasmata archaeon]|nr:TIGR00269 family protein [Thermoplasmata archaeon]MBE3142169.1 TIGR00269 family protein [Thermoplasmata archaeon]